MNDTKISRYISYLLRHHPEDINASVDTYGFMDVDTLLIGLGRKGYKINIERLEKIVREDNKRRYSFNSDHTKIRANQGHSIKVNVELKEITPPDTLYHGTAIRFLDTIMEEGLKPMSRLYVHLSFDYETALKVGSRHGKPCVLKVDAKSMVKDGIHFYLSSNNIPLVKYVSPNYLEKID